MPRISSPHCFIGMATFLGSFPKEERKDFLPNIVQLTTPCCSRLLPFRFQLLRAHFVSNDFFLAAALQEGGSNWDSSRSHLVLERPGNISMILASLPYRRLKYIGAVIVQRTLSLVCELLQRAYVGRQLFSMFETRFQNAAAVVLVLPRDHCNTWSSDVRKPVRHEFPPRR